jgi:PAS domain S-box-containing protein
MSASFDEELERRVAERTAELLAANDRLQKEIAKQKLVLETLRESEAQYKAIFDQVPVAIFTKNKEGVYTSLNAHTLRYWFQNPLGHTDIELLGPEIGQALRANDLVVIETGQEQAVEEMVHTPEGNRVVLSRKLPTRDTDGNITGIVGISVDITERKRTEEALSQQQLFLRQVLDINPHFIFAKDRQGRFTLANKAFAEAYGTTIEEVIGKTDAEFNPYKEMVERYYRDDMGIIETGQELFIPEEEVINIKGEWLWRTTVKRPIFDETGQVTHVLGVATDITDRKQLEQQLQESLERRGRQVRLATLVAQDIAAAANLDDLYQRVVTQVKEQFGFYHAQLLRYDPDTDHLVLTAGYGEAGQKMLAEGYQVANGVGLIGEAAAIGASILRSNLADDSNWHPNPSLPDTKGEIAVPIKLGQQILGVLDVHTNLAGKLDAEDQLALEGLCGQIAVAIENTRLLTEQKQAEIELEARLQELNTLQRLMTREGWRSFQAIEPDARSGYLFDQTNLQPITSEDLGNGHRYPELVAQSIVDNGHLFAKPVAIQGEVIGQIGIYDDPLQPLTVEDHEFLDAVAEQVSEALERARLLAQTQKRAVELEAVAQVSTVAATTLETDKLLQAVVDLTKSNFGLYHAHVYLLNETSPLEEGEGGILVLAAGAGDIGQQMVAQGWRIPLTHENSIVALTARTQRGVIVNDVRQNPNFLPNSLLPKTQSEMAVPMIVGNKLLGVLDVQADIPNRFVDEDMQIQTTLAAQVAVALQNANLYQQTQVALAETETLYDLGAELNAATTLDEALHAVATPGLMTGAFSVLLLTFELDSTGQPEWAQVRVEWHRDSLVTTPVGARFYLPEFPFSQLWLSDPNNPILIGDVSSDRRLDETIRALTRASGTVALVLMPLTLAGRWVGMVTIGWPSVQSFTITDQRLYRSLMTQAAVAINNLLLFEEARQQAAQLEKLSDIEAALSQVKDEAEILSAVARIIDSDRPFRLGLQYLEVDENGQPVISQTVASWRDGSLWPDDPAIGLSIQLDTFPTTHLWLNSPNNPVFVADSQTDPHINAKSRVFMAQLDIRSIAIMPLYAAGRWHGTLTFTWPEPRDFTSSEQFMLQRLVDPVASVVASRRAYLAQQETLAETEVLYLASRRINEAPNLQDMLAAVAEIGLISIINRILLFLFERNSITDDVEAMTVIANWHSGQGSPPSPVGRRYAQSEFSTVRLMASGEPLFFADTQSDERMDSAIKAVARQQNIRAMAVLPLRASGRQIGVLLLQSEEVYQFSERETQIYLSLAPQISSTLENQHLLEETRAALAEVEAIQRRYTVQAWEEYQARNLIQGYKKVGQQIAPLDDEPLPADVSQAVTHKQTVVATSPLGLPGGQEDRQDEGLMGSSNLIVPLTIRDEVIGVLGVQEIETDRRWSPEEIALVEAIAEQLAQAAESIRLIDETQQRAAREKRVNEIGEKIQAAQSLEEALQIAVREVGLSLKAPQTIVQLAVE